MRPLLPERSWTLNILVRRPAELPNYPPADDTFRGRFAPRGVIHSWATDEDDATEEPRFGRVGRQCIEDTGPLNRKRMETIDDEVLAVARDFIGRQQASGTPFFVWFNTTHMHFRKHPKPESVGQAGRWQSPYHDTMIDHDRTVGELLDTLDELGLAEDTIVVYSTDNGPHMNSWPNAGMTPFRGEKNISDSRRRMKSAWIGSGFSHHRTPHATAGSLPTSPCGG